MNDYERKLEEKRQRMLNSAGKKAAEGASRLHAADVTLEGIPSGQPILVGHHSEKRHRRDLERARNNIDKGYALQDEAAKLRTRAEHLGEHGVSSDDPGAVEKLSLELTERKAAQEKMVAANKIVRGKKLGEPEKIQALMALGIKEAVARDLFVADFAGRFGYPDFRLKNNSSSIKRLEKRIEELTAKSEDESSETEVNGVTILDNVEENRLQMFFKGKPAREVIEALKSRGFRWSPTQGAWQRMRSSQASHHAKHIASLVVGRENT